jgi:hypothetical protein
MWISESQKKKLKRQSNWGLRTPNFHINTTIPLFRATLGALGSADGHSGHSGKHEAMAPSSGLGLKMPSVKDYAPQRGLGASSTLLPGRKPATATGTPKNGTINLHLGEDEEETSSSSGSDSDSEDNGKKDWIGILNDTLRPVLTPQKSVHNKAAEIPDSDDDRQKASRSTGKNGKTNGTSQRNADLNAKSGKNEARVGEAHGSDSTSSSDDSTSESDSSEDEDSDADVIAGAAKEKPLVNGKPESVSPKVFNKQAESSSDTSSASDGDSDSDSDSDSDPDSDSASDSESGNEKRADAKAKRDTTSSDGTSSSGSESEEESDDEIADGSLAITDARPNAGQVPQFMAQDFVLRQAEGNEDARSIAKFFSDARLDGKQVWYFTAPASVPINVVEKLEIPLAEAQNGQPILSHNGEQYGLSIPDMTSTNLIQLLINPHGEQFQQCR